MLGEHAQAGHTHVDPDVGLGGARGRLLPQEEQVAGEELQLGLPRLAVLDHLWRSRMEESIIQKLKAEHSENTAHCLKIVCKDDVLGRLWS